MNDQPVKTAPKDRSPAYPIISLKNALERLERFDTTFGRHPAPFKKAAIAWGIKEGSSQANSVLAALKAYGLIEYQGSGDDRMASISEDGRTYLRAQQEEIKQAVVKRCALKPKAIAQFWPDWKADRPPDAICLDDLVLKHGFNENAAPIFLRVYDETIAFAGLGGSDKVAEQKPDELANEGVDDAEDPPPPPPPPPLSSNKEELQMGERELTTGLLSKSAGFRLIVNGKIGAKEIDRLIAKLQLDKEILAETDESETDE